MTIIERRRELLNNLEYRSRRVLDMIRYQHLGMRDAGRPVVRETRSNSNDLEHFNVHAPLDRPPLYRRAQDGSEEILFQFGPWIQVIIGSIRPATDVKPVVTFGTEEVVDRRVLSAGTLIFRNRTADIPIERERSITDRQEDETTGTTNLSASVKVGFRQMIGYGGEAYGVQGETELTAEVELAAAREDAQRRLRATDDTGATRLTVPCKRLLRASRIRSMGRFRQPVTITGGLDWTMEIASDQDWRVKWLSRSELAQCMAGVGCVPAKSERRENWAALFAAHPLEAMQQRIDKRITLAWRLGECATPLNAVLETTREVERAEEIEWDYSDEEIEG